MKFNQVIGQNDCKKRLIQSVKTNHIAHAQLFVGAQGVGALPLALAYAQYVHCTDRDEQLQDACGRCPSCLKHAKMSHPDMHYVFPMTTVGSKIKVCDDLIHDFRASVLKREGYISLSQWTDDLNVGNKQAIIYAGEGDEILRKMNFKTHEGEYKILLIWLPEKMNTTCANRLLKIIEEPFPKTLYLLVSEDPEQIIQTITSRTQRFLLPSLPDSKIRKALIDRYGIDPEQATQLARGATGNYIEAITSMNENEDTKEFFDTFVLLMRKAYMILKIQDPNDPYLKFNAISEMLATVERISNWGRERQRRYLQYAQRFLRENFIANLACPELNYMNQTEANFSSRFASFINERNIEEFMNDYALAERQIEQNANAHYVFSDLALHTVILFKR